jgi:ectoine hydroxylase-related dioxygenase (phytanoyl-CoA dioxygenase family)
VALFNLKYGEALIWDGGFLEHGTVRNQTDHTRVAATSDSAPIIRSEWKHRGRRF